MGIFACFYFLNNFASCAHCNHGMSIFTGAIQLGVSD